MEAKPVLNLTLIEMILCDPGHIFQKGIHNAQHF